VPAQVNVDEFPSIVSVLEQACERYRDNPAFTNFGTTLSYGDIDRLSRDFAAYLLGELKLKKGDRVALMMPNVLQYPVAIAAVLRACYIVVNVNPLYKPRELQHQLVDSGAQAIIILENFACTLEAVIDQTQVRHVIVASMGDLLGGLKGTIVNFVVRHVKKLVPAFSLPTSIRFNQVLAQASGMTLQPQVLDHQDIAFLQYTGGTTGTAKGAMLTHRNIIANVLQNEAWIPQIVSESKTGNLNFVCALPLYHIFALTVCGLLVARLGAMGILIPNPRDIPGFIKELKKYKIHMLPAVNTLFNGLLNHPDFASVDFSQLKLCTGGGMAVQRSVNDRWRAITGCVINEGYGLSETSPAVTANPTGATEFSGCIGLPLSSTEVKIIDDAGNEVALGAAGEIAIRGPQVMAGYWNKPEETAASMTPDGFFKSGDIGIMDERGYIKIVDRKKDMILVSGFNVYPNEIESVIMAFPGVLECACIGVPDEHTGEAVKLFVVRKNESCTEEALMMYCREQFTGYKRPRHIEFRSELPKSNVGKILRRELRDEVIANKQ
ncbi:MAG TPA: long-chain-fatty-acid--CoA ligase, partial [Herminiimonas sp.]|nr:long-chain-fatty-acid--CoA ligase [Herminiimonas sp.]